MGGKPTPPYEYLPEDRGYTSPCWIWQRGMHRKGYGLTHVRIGNNPARYVTMLAHVRYWEQLNGLVPEGKELDHLCRQRPCCRPDHLEPVTHLENVRRGSGTRLTPADRALIAQSTLPAPELAKMFGVRPDSIKKYRIGVRPPAPEGFIPLNSAWRNADVSRSFLYTAAARGLLKTARLNRTDQFTIRLGIFTTPEWLAEFLREHS